MDHSFELHQHFQRGLGTALSPNWRDLAKADSHAVPDTLAQESSPNLGTARIPVERYTSYEYHRKEVDKVWLRTWQVVCREEEIPDTGDHFVYEVAGLSFLIVRQPAGDFKGYWNVCLHRGRKLCDHHGKGAEKFRCKYHAWTWGTEGKLAFYPGAWDFPDVQPQDFSMREVQVDTWGGFIFINPDRKATPLAHHLGSMPSHFDRWSLEKRFSIWHVQKTIKANWKVAMEAFLESYHVVQTHPQALPSTGEHSTQYDIFDEGDANFSRLITPQAVSSQHNRTPDAKEAIAVSWALLAGLRADQVNALPEHIQDRASLAAWRREALGELTGADYSSLSDAEMLDSIQYWVFPNFCPWYGEGLPLTYQFRPNIDSPDECFMDVWMLVRQPDSAPRPPAAPIVRLQHDEAFQSRPELGAMGEIFDQDDVNMPQVQVGLKTWPTDPEGLTLARYQESRIRYFHQVLAKRIAAP